MALPASVPSEGTTPLSLRETWLVLVAKAVNALLSLLNGGTNGQLLAFVAGAAAWAGDTAWTNVSGGVGFQNGWANFDTVNFQQAAFFKDAAGFVHLRGLVKSGTVGATIFTLPAGYRPGKISIFPATSNTAFGEVRVDASGNVSMFSGSNIYVCFDGITFDTR